MGIKVLGQTDGGLANVGKISEVGALYKLSPSPPNILNITVIVLLRHTQRGAVPPSPAPYTPPPTNTQPQSDLYVRIKRYGMLGGGT